MICKKHLNLHVFWHDIKKNIYIYIYIVLEPDVTATSGGHIWSHGCPRVLRLHLVYVLITLAETLQPLLFFAACLSGRKKGCSLFLSVVFRIALISWRQKWSSWSRQRYNSSKWWKLVELRQVLSPRRTSGICAIAQALVQTEWA